jgi:cation diffusion facilitator family transporter
LFNTPNSVSWLPVITNTFLAALKLAVAFMIGSISVFSDGLDTTVDVMSAFIAFIGVRVAARPPDEGHPYGHGQAEYLSGLIESGLILGGGGFITYQAMQRLITRPELQSVGLGIIALSIALAVNAGVSFQLYRVARKHNSIALEAAAKHRASDMLTSAGVLLGLVFVGLTGWSIIDPIIALGVAAVVFWAGWSIASESIRGLMNPSLANEENARIVEIIESDDDVIRVEHLHSGKVGNFRHIEAVVKVCRELSVAKGHEVIHRVESGIIRAYPESLITLHAEPCTESEHIEGACVSRG